MQDQKNFLIFQFSILLISFFVLHLLFPIGGTIDMQLISPWVTSSGEFYLKNNWYLAKLNHVYVKDVIIFFYTILFFTWLGSFKIDRLRPYRFDFGYFFFVSMLCTISIGIFKAHSPLACPWNMTVPTSHGFSWDFSAQDGHCFPGGHASSGFALITGYFVYRLKQPKRAYFYLISGLTIGFAMGWAQMMRGAHFISHNLWTLWIVLFINFIMYICIQKIYTKYYLKN